MYDATCLVLEKNIIDGSTYSQCGDADNAYKSLTSFEFILILHLMREIMGITNVLCQALQQQSHDIVNVMRLVCFTKGLIQNLRENGWDKLLKNVTSFCEKHDIEVPNFWASYVQGKDALVTKKIILQWSILSKLKYSLLPLISNYKS